MSIIDNFEKMLAAGQDNALLRYSLGNEYLKAGDAATAARHLQSAVEHDRDYSAAWKLLGKALAEAGDAPGAMTAYRTGIEVAERKGDKQAAKEMRVFLKRLEKAD
ncbi:MAG TPA: tetratricopeptide repeat protein [Gammaproteobacteria bacterium]